MEYGTLIPGGPRKGDARREEVERVYYGGCEKVDSPGSQTRAPLHSDIFRPAKLRLAAQKMIFAPGGVRKEPDGMNGSACDR